MSNNIQQSLYFSAVSRSIHNIEDSATYYLTYNETVED